MKLASAVGLSVTKLCLSVCHGNCSFDESHWPPAFYHGNLPLDGGTFHWPVKTLSSG